MSSDHEQDRETLFREIIDFLRRVYPDELGMYVLESFDDEIQRPGAEDYLTELRQAAEGPTAHEPGP